MILLVVWVLGQLRGIPHAKKFSRDLIQLLSGHILSPEQSKIENIAQSTAK